jgi:hypothetical protein
VADCADQEISQRSADFTKTKTPSEAKAPEISPPMLDVHAPHEASHTWQGFFIHIATIVIGLIIAVGLEQTVEYFHHRHQVAESRGALRLEREENKRRFAHETGYWRWEAVELQNNLLVLQYLQQHPGTPEDKLPGVLYWGHRSEPHVHSTWDAIQQTGVAALMPQDEVAEYAELYRSLDRVDEGNDTAWRAINEAERFEFIDSDPSQMSGGALAEAISLTQTALTRHFLLGVALENLQRSFRDFPPTVTLDEVHQLRHPPDGRTRASLNSAEELTNNRLKAAGWVPMKSNDAPPSISPK